MCFKSRPVSRVALCVGVNQYRYNPGNNLRGCVNDARDMGALLASRGYKVSTLLDGAATKANIVARLAAMLAAPGWTQAVFTMSSHGTQVTDVGGDEADRLDEAVCPHDLLWSGGRWQNAITDDEFAAIFAVVQPGQVVDVFLDTCHSGTGIRALAFVGGSHPRYMPPPTIDDYVRIEAIAARRRTGRRALGDNVILWAACQASEYASDAYIDGRYRGAFTAGFLASYQPGLSRQDIADMTVERCARYDQTPQLEAVEPYTSAVPWGY